MKLNYRNKGILLKTLKLSALFLLATTVSVQASESETKSSKDLAQAIANPLTTMIMVPIQYEYNENIGPDDDGTRSTIYVQPVIPFKLNDDWNLITRTIVPIIEQKDIFPGSGSRSLPRRVEQYYIPARRRWDLDPVEGSITHVVAPRFAT